MEHASTRDCVARAKKKGAPSEDDAPKFARGKLSFGCCYLASGETGRARALSDTVEVADWERDEAPTETA